MYANPALFMDPSMHKHHFRLGENSTFVHLFLCQTECEYYKVSMYVKRRLVGTNCTDWSVLMDSLGIIVSYEFSPQQWVQVATCFIPAKLMTFISASAVCTFHFCAN